MEKTPEGRDLNSSPIKRLMNRFLPDTPDDSVTDEQVNRPVAYVELPPTINSTFSKTNGVKHELDTPMQKLEQSQPRFTPNSSSLNRGNVSELSSQNRSDWGLEWLFNVADRMRQAETIDALLAVTIADIHQHLNADRVLIYQFQGEYQGSVVAESMVNGYTPSLGESLPAIAFGAEAQRDYERYPFVAISATPDVLTPYQAQLLERFQVKASLSLPILVDQELWGLLVIQQCGQPRRWEEAEVIQLHQAVRELRLNLQPVEARVQRQKQVAQDKIIAKMIRKIHESLDVVSVFNTTTQEVRQQLKCDRVTVFQFKPDWSGKFVSESVAPNWVPLVGVDSEIAIADTYLQDTQGGRYRNNETLAVDDIYQSDLAPCHIEILESFQAKSMAIVPILDGENLWGLLAAYQNTGPRHWTSTDVNLLVQVGRQFGLAIRQAEYVDQLRGQSEQLKQTAERRNLTLKTIERIRQSLDLQTTFKTTAREIRNFLQVDRVAIFKFDPDSGYSNGKTIAEDVKAGLTSALSVQVEDHCFSKGFAEQYRQGRVFATSDIYKAGLQDCYIEVLSQFQVRANLVVPLLKGEDLWGLFCVHHCTEAREWSDEDIEFAKQIAAQLNVAIQQGEYVEQLKQQSEQLAESAERERSAKERLQMEVIGLLTSVRPALAGDLTVRAPVTDSEVGTIADAYNNTLNSLRQTVTQMQSAANQVAHTSQSNNIAITQLAIQAQNQLQALEQAFEQVQAMVTSTHHVEVNAQQVETAVQQANQTVLAGDAAIDRTVDEMEEIRATVVETSRRLQRLSEASQKISRVVNLIGQFTTQTQLLALNASIEATRAGDFGRGFAVVADEVRSLARQSATAATEIEQLVQDIQMSTSEVATAMETGIEQVASGTTVVTEAREHLNAIVNATAQISQLVSGITQATQGQTLQCQSVTDTMQHVATIATQTSQDAATISESFQGLLATAQDLQSKSEQFKVA
jgi:methyl-accepting chemotaxis protein PixJ